MSVEVVAAHDGKRTSYVELFFDLVFVFAITQLAGLLKHRHDGAGWVHVALAPPPCCTRSSAMVGLAVDPCPTGLIPTAGTP
ncbi:MAG: hypothetical protein F2789_01285 [Actinobacteria bacterium]|nr:hypothetical protein [Actinomycetota bacterium]